MTWGALRLRRPGAAALAIVGAAALWGFAQTSAHPPREPAAPDPPAAIFCCTGILGLATCGPYPMPEAAFCCSRALGCWVPQ